MQVSTDLDSKDFTVSQVALTNLTAAKLGVLNVPHGGFGIGCSVILNETVGIFERDLCQSTKSAKQLKNLVFLNPLV